MRQDKQKSILIVDKPVNCDECDICYPTEERSNDKHYFCPIIGYIDKEIGQSSVQVKCPLRDIPQFQVVNEYDFEHYINGVAVGWNRCLEAITGEVPDYAKTKGHEIKNDNTGAEIGRDKETGGD